MGKQKKKAKEPASAPKPKELAIPPFPEGRTFNAPMPDKTFLCDLCGGVMYESHCKIICQFCGYIRDCSDP